MPAESFSSCEAHGARRLTKNEKRRQKKKVCHLQDGDVDQKLKTSVGVRGAGYVDSSSSEVEIEYVSVDYDHADLGADFELVERFKDIFNKFAKPEDLLKDDEVVVGATETAADASIVATAATTDSAESEAIATSEATKLSKKKKKLMNRLSVAELKQLVSRPDVVEVHDVTSSDPRLLVHLKSYRNTVPVPRHWCHIRKYLTGKVGMEKPPFQLPEFIAETGIAKIRDAVMEQEALKKSKAKARERIRPKMGKIDIDYQVLHDAFFKYQTKPKLSLHGDLYYEGKEYEVSMKEMKPGMMSAELLSALGMADNEGTSSTTPPPWLINMQRYGPPPSYPMMKIPGLNAPLPPGANYGYQPGGWGKPPVDEYGRPIYGDVFGTTEADSSSYADQVIDKALRWGALEAEEFFDTAADDDEYDDEADLTDHESYRQGFDSGGTETPNTIDGLNSLGTGISGLETPDTIDLRKRAGMDTPDTGYSSGPLYHVIQERQSTNAAAVGQMFGSDRVYVLPGGQHTAAAAAEGSSLETADTRLLPSSDGAQTEDSQAGTKGGKKRKVDSSSAAMKRLKDFKF